MKPRAWHNKSRKGCKACKTRRVKCDQARPVCGHCARLYSVERCEYEHLVAPLIRQNGSTPTATKDDVLVDGLDLKRPSDFDRRIEARLLYQWYSSTSRSLPSHYDPDNINFWSNTVSMWATEHDFVLDAVMAMAAMHLRSESHEKNCEFRQVSMLLMNAAITKHRQLYAHVEKTIAEPLLAASILTGFQSHALLALESEVIPYQLPVDQFEFQRGLMAVYNLVMPHMTEDSYLRKVNQLETAEWPSGLPLGMLDALDDEEVKRDAEMLLDRINSSMLHSEEAKDILRNSLSYLMSIEFGLKVGEPHEWTRRRAATMPCRIPVGYISLLKQQDLLAMSILARFYALLKLIDSRDPQWWASGTSDRQVRGIISLVSQQSHWLFEAALERIATGFATS